METYSHTRRPLYLLGLLLTLAFTFAIAGCSNEGTPPAAGVAEGYPLAAATATLQPYPLTPSEEPLVATPQTTVTQATPTVTTAPLPGDTPTVTPPAPATNSQTTFLPLLNTSVDASPTATHTPQEGDERDATPTAMASPASTPSSIATVDFAAAREELNAQGRRLAFSKIGFHVTFLEQKDYLDEWMQQLDAAGVPFFLKTVDNAEPLYEAQQLRQASGVPHTLVFRATGGVPNYDLPPEAAAREHWEFHRDKFPPELDPSLVWIETVNEVDKNRSEWLAAFALETAGLAMADGFRWAAFGWAPGEPRITDWESPVMLEFLRLAGENPEQLAIAVHEGSLTIEDIKYIYPYHLGRFLQLFDVADRHGIPRPTVLITEWGWAYDDVPDVEQAMADVEWAARLYAPFPQVKGAAMWNLGYGCCFGNVSEQVRQLIDPLRRFSLTNYFSAPMPPTQAPTDPALYR